MKTIEKTRVEKTTQTDPSKIMHTGMGFWPSKVLLTAVKMYLFTHLSTKPLSDTEIKNRLGLHNRGLYDFMDTLVALEFLQRKGYKETAVYSNEKDADTFLDKMKPSYIGGLLEMANNRLYPFWNYLEEGLKTGNPQNEIRNGRKPLFEEIYSDIGKTREFVNAMAGAQMGNFMAFASQFDFSDYHTLCDIGGAGAHLSSH
jgi:hypothetical protein